jgi:hypothetical protein
MSPEWHIDTEAPELVQQATYRLLLGMADADRQRSPGETSRLRISRELLMQDGWTVERIDALKPAASLDDLSADERAAAASQPLKVVQIISRLARLDRLKSVEEEQLRRLGQQLGPVASDLIEELIQAHVHRRELGATIDRLQRQVDEGHARIGRSHRGLWVLGALLGASMLAGAIGHTSAMQDREAHLATLAASTARAIYHVETTCALRSTSTGEDVKPLRKQGTAFLLEGGKLVTNKHVAAPCLFDEASTAQGHVCSGHTHSISYRGQRLFTIADPTRLELPPESPEDWRTRNVDGVRIRVHRSNQNDYAVLRVGDLLGPTAAALTLSDQAPRRFQFALVVGHEGGNRDQVTSFPGEIARISPNEICLSSPLLEGMSGSPVVDESGRVLGIATRSPAASDTTVLVLLPLGVK